MKQINKIETEINCTGLSFTIIWFSWKNLLHAVEGNEPEKRTFKMSLAYDNCH
jgi:hypothetical protein